MRITLDKDSDIPIYSPTCTTCRHLRDNGKDRTCDAFERAIPLAIWRGDNDHQKPYPGDNGIQYDPINQTDNDRRAT